MVKSRQEKWKTRLENMSMERIVKEIFEGEMQGKRPRGRPIFLNHNYASD